MVNDHNENCRKFQEPRKRRRLVLNGEKSVKSVSSVNILGYCVSYNSIKPHAVRLQSVDQLPPPPDLLSIRRTLGMFAYYSKWIPSFADRVHPLINLKSFPINEEALSTFNLLKKELHSASEFN